MATGADNANCGSLLLFNTVALCERKSDILAADSPKGVLLVVHRRIDGQPKKQISFFAGAAKLDLGSG